ncbi:tRNA intron endonuclease [Zychaea mexicana]|uniref:tRNA intron endonuclease n=1 Tax=Zychaea mexicana TaxID=64656 RepID=UPI0022FE8675|nr:tRNA intron endonuclease [Zychaea mexicana]KAI9491556.1 tRNA intron endonuclease [Zychaea mexicana]
MTVRIKLCGNKPLVFDTQDVKELRCQHRIVGALIGTLPRLPQQNAFLGLPLQLLPEELTLLVTKNIAIIGDSNNGKTWTYLNTKAELLRYKVFEHLWSRQLYVTSGLKFGGDYLAYRGDPMRFHSHYIVSAKDRHEPMTGLDVIGMGRLATNVKKTYVIASPASDNDTDSDENSAVEVFSIEWAGF